MPRSSGFRTCHVILFYRVPFAKRYKIAAPVASDFSGSMIPLNRLAFGEFFEKIRRVYMRGRELVSLIRQGAVDGLSIGFRVKRFRREPKRQSREILSLDLWEISLVSFPLLPQARLVNAGRKALTLKL